MKNLLGKLRVVALILVGIVLATIVVQNTEVVETRLLFFTVSMPRAALLFGTALIGFALGVIVATRLVGKGKPKKT